MDVALTPEYIPNQSCPAALEVIQLTPEEVEAAENAYRQSKLENLPIDVGKLKLAEQWSAALRSMINTDAESARKITSGYVMADRNPDFAVRWKIETGRFVTLNAATIIAIGDAVTAHVQACFDDEDVLTTAILGAKDHAALVTIDIGSGWPA